MGAHSKARKVYDSVADALSWVGRHRRKIYAVAMVVIPLASRYVPDFPSDTLLNICRAFLGT